MNQLISIGTLNLAVKISLTGSNWNKIKESGLQSVDTDVTGDPGTRPAYDIESPAVDVSIHDSTVSVPEVSV